MGAWELCEKPIVQAGNDDFCSLPSGHEGPCAAVHPVSEPRDNRCPTCGSDDFQACLDTWHLENPPAPPDHGERRCHGTGNLTTHWDDPRGPEFNNAPDSTAGGSLAPCPGCPDCRPDHGESERCERCGLPKPPDEADDAWAWMDTGRLLRLEADLDQARAERDRLEGRATNYHRRALRAEASLATAREALREIARDRYVIGVCIEIAREALDSIPSDEGER